MNRDENKINEFYKNWILLLPSIIEGYIYDEEKKLYPTRYIFSMFKNVIKNFLDNKLGEYEKIILLPGIRGVGKTTLLSQIYNIEKFLKPDTDILFNFSKIEDRLYLDVSKLRLENISLNDFFKFYEKLKNFHFETLDKKFILLLDEVHYDSQWGLFLKNVFDRTKRHKNILIIATGSSAINLKMNPDLSRRSSVIEMYPLKFNEYLILKYKIHPIQTLSENLSEIIFNSNNATGIFRKLKDRALEIDRFFINIPQNAEEDFFAVGGFPTSSKSENKIKSSELIKNVINNIIAKDILSLDRFKTQILAKINDLLYLLAHSDVISYEKLITALKIGDYKTINSLIETLIDAGILIKIKSIGKTYGGARKTPKFLFISSSLRSAVLDNIFPAGIEGKKLEDYFALVYMKDLKSKFAIDLSYDIAEGGADFILTLKDRSKIVIEVGLDKEEIKQVLNTQKKIKSKYGMVFGSKDLELVNDSIVKIPLKYLLMI